MKQEANSSTTIQRSLQTARTRFFDGGELPAALLPPLVAQSWQRSRDSGLRPWQAPQYDQTLSCLQYTPADRRLRQCVEQEIEPLWSAFGGTDWTIFCVNPEGVIVHARHNPSSRDSILQPIAAGRRIHESHVGTTAPGCAMHDSAEVIVTGNQHYLEAFACIFCLAMPLFGLDGEVIGALDITGKGQRNAYVLREHFRLAVLSAQQRLFASAMRHCHLLRVQHDPRWLPTPLAGVLAVNDDGQVCAASLEARRLLALPSIGPLPRVDLRQLFVHASQAQQRGLLQLGRPARRIVQADGSHLWVQPVRAPLNRTVPRPPLPRSQQPSPPVADAVSGNLNEQMLLAVRRTLHEHDGNISTASKQLGISRTTFYSKLRQLQQAGLLPTATDGE
ncbi:helix-turn-helix domain-containing protein [Paraburkholderia sediminicola]|uniref:helix-turn-helix domain-containing protein n=1 Tax=Paraburkholderia sediminicola TaxID=458836 RepID=UPI0038B7FC51